MHKHGPLVSSLVVLSATWYRSSIILSVSNYYKMASNSVASISPTLPVTGEHSSSTGQSAQSVRSPVWNYLEYELATGKCLLGGNF